MRIGRLKISQMFLLQVLILIGKIVEKCKRMNGRKAAGTIAALFQNIKEKPPLDISAMKFVNIHSATVIANKPKEIFTLFFLFWNTIKNPKAKVTKNVTIRAELLSAIT